VAVADLDAEETRRSHPHNGKGSAIEDHISRQRAGVATEFALPERIADHRAGGAAAGLVVLSGEGAAQYRHDPEHVEEISADILTLRVTGDTAEGKIEAPCTPGDRACEEIGRAHV